MSSTIKFHEDVLQVVEKKIKSTHESILIGLSSENVFTSEFKAFLLKQKRTGRLIIGLHLGGISGAKFEEIEKLD